MSKEEELTLEEQVERIRQRRQHGSHESVRRWLNIIFMALAAVGVAWYYADPQHRTSALILIAVGMVLKVVEFALRFMG